MKTKLKTWQISLLAIFTIMFAALASIFSLKADTVDEEETPEELVDNWSLDVVFYDSSVDGGNTPLTEINWDASNGSYGTGETRVITVQINYKNINAVTKYDIGDLEIRIPNLIYDTNSAYSAQWNSSVTVGANDQTHTGYDWTFVSNITNQLNPSIHHEYYAFTNAKVIEEKANFEGSIQIVYQIQPVGETTSGSYEIEEYDDSCIHDFSKTLQATLGKTGDIASTEEILSNTEHIITSPNWPNNYDNSLSATTTYWEYTSDQSDNLYICFDDSSVTESNCDYIYIYDKTGILKYKLSGIEMAGKTYKINGNYVKIAMKSDGSSTRKGFSVSIGSGETKLILPDGMIASNPIQLNYTRTYTHPWQQRTYSISKLADKVTSLDGFPQGDYYWVRYKILMGNGDQNWSRYPYVGINFYVSDTLPAECVVLDHNFNQLTLENGLYTDSYLAEYQSVNNRYDYLYVGYPKSVYNEEAGNLNITNHVDLYIKYGNESEYKFTDDAEVSINLADFEFEYSGNLYSVSKKYESYYDKIKLYSRFLLDEDFIHNCNYCNGNWQNDYQGRHVTTAIKWNLSSTSVYIGNPLTIQLGDDLAYITDSTGNYRKLNDDEYYIEYIHLPKINNMNGLEVSYNKYNSSLYVKYAGDADYTFYQSLTSNKKGDKFDFSSGRKVVAFYIQIEDALESLVISNYKNDGNDARVTLASHIKPKGNISSSGTIYNFSFLKTYFKDENGNLILQNEPELSSYATITTQDNIAQYDLDTYGHYVQRAESSVTYKEYIDPESTTYIEAYNSMNPAIQDSENECFVINQKIGFAIKGSHEFISVTNDMEYLQNIYFNFPNDIGLITNIHTYDLLPKGLELDLDTTNLVDLITSERSSFYKYYYYIDGTKAFNSDEEMLSFIKEHSSFNITENWNNTGRTRIEWNVDFEDSPLLNTISYWDNGSLFVMNLKTIVSYDSYLEYGNVWKNYSYAEGLNSKNKRLYPQYLSSTPLKDNGHYDIEASDINENQITEEIIGISSASVTITSVVSTHQDLTTYVQTSESNYSTGIVDAPCNDTYQYKLRIRSGASDITNLILYCNLEEAQPERTRWKGEFLGIDTTYAENKGYNVKTYYSTNPAAQNLYNENGTINSDWKEYSKDYEELYANGLKITFNEQCATVNSSDYFYIYYLKDNTSYRSTKYYGTSIAGLTVEIPSTDFYIYWYSNSSSNNAYGISIDSIEPIYVTNPISASSSSLPTTVEPIKLTGNNYPETEHNPYNNTSSSQTIMWHYKYAGNLLIRERDQILSTMKSFAFEYLDTNGNAAILPANSLTYVLINMKAPADDSITTLARNNSWVQWNAIDEFGGIVDGIVGINSNVVKVALPNSVKTDDMPSISLRFTKEIQGIDAEFENMLLNKADNQIFAIRLTSLTANNDGTYNQVTGLLGYNTGLVITQIPIGTYLLEELGDNYFDFVDFTDNNDPEIIIEGVTFEKTDQGYIITVSEDLSQAVEFNIKVTNEIEDERFFEDKDNKENLFLKNKTEEDLEDPS